MVTALVVFCLLISSAILYSVCVYNAIVRKNVRCDEAWDAYETELGKRSEIVVDLLHVASAHAHDGACAQAVVDAWYALDEATGAAGTMEASDYLGRTVKDLVDEMQGDDEVGASASFQEIATRLDDAEKRIASTRQAFVSSVDAYNAALATRPATIVAGPRFHVREGGTAKPQS